MTQGYHCVVQILIHSTVYFDAKRIPQASCQSLNFVILVQYTVHLKGGLNIIIMKKIKNSFLWNHCLVDLD